MCSRRRLVCFFLFAAAASASWASAIARKMAEESYTAVIRPFASKWYVGTLHTEGNKLRIEYGSDFGKYPTFMAYKISDYTIEIIIKSVPLDSAAVPPGGAPGANWTYSPTFYLLTLSLNDGVITYTCYYVENPSLISGGFTFNRGAINESGVNVRRKPTTESEIHRALYRSDTVIVTAVGEDLYRVAHMADFWLEIQLDRGKYWVYGYYVEFPGEITLS